jgi:iron complex outermembrane recepter protein
MIRLWSQQRVSRPLLPPRAAATAILLAFGPSAPSWAQAADAASAPEPSAAASAPAAEVPSEPGTQRIEVTGSRYKRTNTTETALKMPVPVRETPMNVNVLTDKFIDDIGALSLDDAVKYVSSVSKSRNFGAIYDQFNIRGQFVDQVNGYRLDGGAYLNFFSPDFSAIESIEVLKGPVSTLYGAGLGGGVVNFLSKRPTAKPQYGAEVTLGSEGLRRGEFDISIPASESLGFRITGASERAGSFTDTVTSRRTSLYGVAEFRPGESTLVSFRATHQSGKGTHWRGIPVFQDEAGNIRVPYDLPRNTFVGEDWNRWNLEFSTARLSAEHEFDNGVRIMSQVSHSRITRDIYSSVADSPIDPATGNFDLLAVRDDGNASPSTTAEINLSAPFKLGGIKGVALLGLDYATLKIPYIESEAPLGVQNISAPARGSRAQPSLPVVGFEEQSSSTGVFVQVNLEPTDWLRVLLGVRYDASKGYFRDEPQTFREVYDTSDTTYRLGLTYLATPDFSVYGGVSTGFSPTQTIGIAGTVLPSETAVNYEIGIKGDFLDKKLALAAALFSTTRKNVPIELSDSDNPFPFISGGRQSFKGLELDLSYGPTPGVDIYASYSFIKARDEAGNVPLGVPKQQLGLLASYEHQTGTFKGYGTSLALQYMSRTPGTFDNAFFIDGYTTAQLQFFSKGKPISWSLAIDNLTDEKYFASGEGGLARGLTFGAPRSVSFNVGVEF